MLDFELEMEVLHFEIFLDVVVMGPMLLDSRHETIVQTQRCCFGHAVLGFKDWYLAGKRHLEHLHVLLVPFGLVEPRICLSFVQYELTEDQVELLGEALAYGVSFVFEPFYGLLVYQRFDIHQLVLKRLLNLVYLLGEGLLKKLVLVGSAAIRIAGQLRLEC